MPYELSIEQAEIERVGRILKDEADGKALRKEMSASLREIVKAPMAEAKASVLALPSSPGPREGGSLRQAISREIKPEARLQGRDTGVKVRVSSRRMPRNFKLAARRLNSGRIWRHPVFGTDVWVEQQTPRRGWFDEPFERDRERFTREVMDVVESMAQRIADRAN